MPKCVQLRGCLSAGNLIRVLQLRSSFVFLIVCLIPSLCATQSNDKASDLDWQHYGNDLANTRFQDADQINPGNVSRLKPAWIFHTGVLDPEASLEVSPIVVNGMMFVTSGHDDVFALDAATGKQIWAYHPKLIHALSELSICCGR